MDNVFLDLNEPPAYNDSAFRELKNEKHPRRIFGLNVLILVVKGVLVFTEDGEEVNIAAGEYYIQRAWKFHDSTIPSTANFYFIHFYGVFVESKLNNIPLKGNFDIDDVLPLLQQMDKLFFEQKLKVRVIDLFYQVLYKLYEYYRSESYQMTLAEQIAEYITQHYYENILLEDIKKQFRYSKEYIVREFKSIYKITPHKYITQIRIMQAKRLLISTNKTVAQISKECGYDDFSVFYRAFFAQTGKKPLEWKKGMIYNNSEK